MSRVLLVGNGGSLKDKNISDIIDSFDIVCRFNFGGSKITMDENKKYIGRDRSGPGGIQFTYGEDRNHNVSAINLFPNEGDFFIFPANLRHVVYPFKSECTRVSMSANINLV